MRRYRFQPARFLLAVLIALSAIQSLGSNAGVAQVVGNSYTSPTYGYSISWNETWFVEEESVEPQYDVLRLTNGVASAQLYGEPFTLPIIAAITTAEVSMQADPSFSNVRYQLDSAGNEIKGEEENRVYAAFAATLAFEDGTEAELGMYVEARPIVPGESLVTFIGTSLLSYYQSMATQYDKMLETLTIPGQASEPEPVAGEPAPAFASEPWRFGIAHTAQGAALPEIGLAEKAGKEWLVVVIDTANWSAAPKVLNLRDFRVVAGDEPIRVAPASTRAVADDLGTTAIGEGLTLEIVAGESARVALVFSIPAAASERSLTIGDERIPLDELVDVSITRENLPLVALPGAVEEAEIVSASDGKTMRVLIQGESDSRRIQLAGVEPPAEGACFEHAAEVVLDDLVGAAVLVEAEENVTGGSIPIRYIWLINADGTRTLLNEDLIAKGLAFAASLPGSARFGLWMESSANSAEENGVGLWDECSTAKATPVDD